jgi:hypothetical protein
LQDDDIRRQLYTFARAVVARRPDTRLIYADRQRPL